LLAQTMNPSDPHRNQVTKGGPGRTYTSRHLLPPSRLVAPAFIHGDQEARTAQDVQYHAQSEGVDVSQFVRIREEGLTRAQLLQNRSPPQTFLPHGPLPGSTSDQYHVQLAPNPPYTVGNPQTRTLASSYSTFDQSAFIPKNFL
jgi:hypothetical protein